ncbi:MAG: hypothetical protein GF411_19845 [Candidatus Lokiarchaeota archaeon]|nr:hypothetical protein [Candidatus Lokiarchaeota archaeon]
MRDFFLRSSSKSKEVLRSIVATKYNEILMESMLELFSSNEAIQRVFEKGVQLGPEFLAELTPRPDDELGAIRDYAELGWELFAGHRPIAISWERKKLGDIRLWMYEIKDDDCPFCRNMTAPCKFCYLPAGIIQGAVQAWSNYLHNGSYKAICRETCCSAIGDPYCQWTLILVQRLTAAEDLESTLPDIFNEIPASFSTF